MLSVDILPFLILEICISFTLIRSCVQAYDSLLLYQILLPLILHYSTFVLKCALLIKSHQANLKQTLWCSALIVQSLSFGIVGLYFRFEVSYLQVLVTVQFVLVLRLVELYRPAMIMAIFFVVPEVFQNYASLYKLLESILSCVVALNLTYCVDRSAGSLDNLTSRRNYSSTKPPAFEEQPIKTSIKDKILETMYLTPYRSSPFITDEHFLVINSRNQIVYDQLEVERFYDESIRSEKNFEDQVLSDILEIKCDTMTSNLNNILIENEQMFGDRSEQQQPKPNLGEVCDQLFSKTDSWSQIYTVFHVESKALRVAHVKINLFVLRVSDAEDLVIILHFQTYPERRFLHSKSDRTQSLFPTHGSVGSKTQDSISSTLISNIFKSVSHEFGTYLNCIMTVSEEALYAPFDNDLKQTYFEPININANLLNYILMNIRDFNSILLKQFTLKLQEFSPYNVLNEINKQLSNQSESRNNQMLIDCPDDLVIYNDQDRFKQVVYQLISNAMRFTQDGKIQIIIKQINFDRSQVQVSVRDTGIGMDVKEQKKLQEMLADSTKMLRISRNSVGCGLGLGISNEIVKKMNGSSEGLSFQSNQMEGSHFYFKITNFEQLYNESLHGGTYTALKVQNDTIYYRERPFSEAYSERRISQVGNGQHEERSDSIREKSDIRDVRGTKSKSNSMRKQSNETSYQFAHKWTEQSQFKYRVNYIQAQALSDEELNSQEESIINIPSFTLALKPQILQYKISSVCCRRVLIVDDEFFNISSLQLILKRFQAQADYAFNGKQALEKAELKLQTPCKLCQSAGYIVYFLDLNMPIMDGFMTVQEIKKRMNNRELPKGVCIANSGYADLESKQRAAQYGMDFYLTKPINIQELENYLRQKFKECL